MPYVLPEDAIPIAEPAVVELVSEILPDLDVSTPRRGSSSGAFPRVRLTPVYSRRAPNRWERTPVFQVDIWAEDEGTAGDLAAYLAYHWERTMRRDLASGGYVSSCFVDSDPMLMPTVNETDPARYFLQIGLLLHPARPGD